MITLAYILESTFYRFSPFVHLDQDLGRLFRNDYNYDYIYHYIEITTLTNEILNMISVITLMSFVTILHESEIRQESHY